METINRLIELSKSQAYSLPLKDAKLIAENKEEARLALRIMREVLEKAKIVPMGRKNIYALVIRVEDLQKIHKLLHFSNLVSGITGLCSIALILPTTGLSPDLVDSVMRLLNALRKKSLLYNKDDNSTYWYERMHFNLYSEVKIGLECRKNLLDLALYGTDFLDLKHV